MRRTELLMSYVPLADFIAKMNGDQCEAVIHDVRDLEHSVLYVTQPSLTNRYRGDGMTDYAVELIRTKRYLQDDFVVNYVGGTDERVFRSSTYFIKEEEELVGLLCVNVDVQHLLVGMDILKQALILDVSKLHRQENFRIGSSLEDRMEDIFREYMGDRTPEQMHTKERRHLVHELCRDGVFEIKGMVSEIACRLGVSEKTIYRYLKMEEK